MAHRLKLTPADFTGERTPVTIAPPTAKAKAPASGKGEPPIFRDWKAGTPIHELVGTYKLTRSQCRRQLTDAAGGKPAFRALRAHGAGGIAVPFGGKRHTREPGAPSALAVSDAHVKHITKQRSQDGWTWERRYKPVIATVKGVGNIPWRKETALIFISPKGKRYVQAKGAEKADLIRDFPGTEGLPPMRLKLYAESAVARQARREAKELAHGEAALARTRTRKRTARAARTARRGK